MADRGPFRLLKHDRLRLMTDPVGDIAGDDNRLGLYDRDTRILSGLALTVLRQRLVAGHPIAPGSWHDSLMLSVVDQPAIAVERQRTVAGALTERIVIRREQGSMIVPSVAVRFEFDAADIFEVRGYPRPSRGELRTPSASPGAIRFQAIGLDGWIRTTRITLDPPADLVTRTVGAVVSVGSEAVAVDVRWTPDRLPVNGFRVAWTIRYAERPSARVVGADRSGTGSVRRGRVSARSAQRADTARARAGAAIEIDDPDLQRVFDRSLRDLHLLTETGPDPTERWLVAGLPWYAALYGRDSILTAHEAMAFHPEIAGDVLRVLAARQASDSGPGVEPGQILHELRTGEMARTREIPFTPSYGSVDATPLWLVLLGETVAWTGDDALLEELWPHALRALDWIDQAIARGHGFIDYVGQPGALANEGWKDSPDSVRDRTGRIAAPPIALAEVQAYVHSAWLRTAALATARGETALASRLRRQARHLRRLFDAAFWVADRGCVAMALDGARRPADAITSNAGQCLWGGILRPVRAAAVARRMLAPDMFSGWGIRTMASSEPAYDPLSYHNGSIWPHDTSLIAEGLKRTGFDAEAARLGDALLVAAQAFEADRLPELFSGAPRVADRGPEPYPDACSVQAWSSAAPLHGLRTQLGLAVDGQRRRVRLERPDLPSSATRLVLRGLRVGPVRIDLEASRGRGDTIDLRIIGANEGVDLIVDRSRSRGQRASRSRNLAT